MAGPCTGRAMERMANVLDRREGMRSYEADAPASLQSIVLTCTGYVARPFNHGFGA